MIRRSICLRSTNQLVLMLWPAIVSYLTILLYATINPSPHGGSSDKEPDDSNDTNSLSAITVLVVLAFLNVLRFPIMLLPDVIQCLVDGFVASKRITSYLSHGADGIPPHPYHDGDANRNNPTSRSHPYQWLYTSSLGGNVIANHRHTLPYQSPSAVPSHAFPQMSTSPYAVQLRNASFAWTSLSSSQGSTSTTPSSSTTTTALPSPFQSSSSSPLYVSSAHPILHSLNLDILPGELVAIIGML